MEEFEEIEFVIPAYTPETMPLDRLLQYLQQIGEVIGLARDMHLVRIDESSTKPIFKMPVPAARRAREAASAMRSGGGAQPQKAAYQRIRQMVQRDGGFPASLKDSKGVILDFPSTPAGDPAISGVQQHTVFDGSLHRIGGRGDFIAIQMQDLTGEVHSGFTAPKHIAKSMAPLIFEPIRVSGRGSWDRNALGEWKLVKMLIQAYEPMGQENIGDVLRDLRTVAVNWPDNAEDILSDFRDAAA